MLVFGISIKYYSTGFVFVFVLHAIYHSNWIKQQMEFITSCNAEKLWASSMAGSKGLKV